MLVGNRGNPDVCVVRSASVIARPFLDGTVTEDGRYLEMGSSSATSPRSIMSASRSAVNTFVIDPISNTVSLPGAGPPLAIEPYVAKARPAAVTKPIATPTVWPPSTRSARAARVVSSIGGVVCAVNVAPMSIAATQYVTVSLLSVRRFDRVAPRTQPAHSPHHIEPCHECAQCKDAHQHDDGSCRMMIAPAVRRHPDR